MSKITSPILLDATGKDINSTLRGISQQMSKVDKAFIDDSMGAFDRVWSSAKIIETFTVPQTAAGSTVEIKPVEGTPIIVETPVKEQTTLVLTIEGDCGEATQFTTVIPCAGTYNWNTGAFVLPNGEIAQLNRHNIVAFCGTNSLSVNEGTLTAIYRVTLMGGSSEVVTPSIIYGGSAEEV